MGRVSSSSTSIVRAAAMRSAALLAAASNGPTTATKCGRRQGSRRTRSLMNRTTASDSTVATRNGARVGAPAARRACAGGSSPRPRRPGSRRPSTSHGSRRCDVGGGDAAFVDEAQQHGQGDTQRRQRRRRGPASCHADGLKRSGPLRTANARASYALRSLRFHFGPVPGCPSRARSLRSRVLATPHGRGRCAHPARAVVRPAPPPGPGPAPERHGGRPAARSASASRRACSSGISGAGRPGVSGFDVRVAQTNVVAALDRQLGDASRQDSRECRRLRPCT